MGEHGEHDGKIKERSIEKQEKQNLEKRQKRIGRFKGRKNAHGSNRIQIKYRKSH